MNRILRALKAAWAYLFGDVRREMKARRHEDQGGTDEND